MILSILFLIVAVLVHVCSFENEQASNPLSNFYVNYFFAPYAIRCQIYLIFLSNIWKNQNMEISWAIKLKQYLIISLIGNKNMSWGPEILDTVIDVNTKFDPYQLGSLISSGTDSLIYS